MSSRRFASAAIASVLVTLAVHAMPPDFVPDRTFTGSSLSEWHPSGQSQWRAVNGEIIGVAAAGANGGWLQFDKSFQDVAFYAAFKCAGSCQAGVLLRAEKTADGGTRGIYVPLTPDLAGYRVTFDAQAHETGRQKLSATGSLGRLSTAQQSGRGGRGAATGDNAPAAGRGGRGGRGATPDNGDDDAARPITRADGWNTVEIIIDADKLRPGIDGRATPLRIDGDEAVNGFGPFALHVAAGEVHFKELGWRDLQLRHTPVEQTSSHFRKQQLNEFYYSWSPAIADINRDGIPDIVTGPNYYLGPDYTEAHEIYVAHTFNASDEYPLNSRVKLAYDFTGDGWPDVLSPGLGDGALYVNPHGESRRWDKFQVLHDITTEVALLRDVDGDGKSEVVYAQAGVMGYAKPDPAAPTKPWIFHAVSSGPRVNAHGLGVGDINGDGRPDIVNSDGWWEQPVQKSTTPWTFHPQKLGDRGGAAEMAVYDVNGDGLNDVVGGLAAHGFGLAWFEQKRAADGSISFVTHMIMDDYSTASSNAGGITFSELHAAASADVDGDGVPDFIVGKRYWSHQDGYADPDPYGPPVLYVYRTVRNPKAPGGAEFVPELISNKSGIGSRIDAVDLNNDGAIDIIVTDDRGTFIFWGLPRTRPWRQPARSNGAR
jgi:hypothetical protein